MYITMGIVLMCVLFIAVLMTPTKPVKEISKLDQLLESIKLNSQETETNCVTEVFRLKVIGLLNDYQAKKMKGDRETNIRDILLRLPEYGLDLMAVNLSEALVRQWWQEDYYYEAIKHYNDYLVSKNDRILKYFRFMPAMMFKNDLAQLGITPLAFLRFYRRVNTVYVMRLFK